MRKQKLLTESFNKQRSIETLFQRINVKENNASGISICATSVQNHLNAVSVVLEAFLSHVAILKFSEKLVPRQPFDNFGKGILAFDEILVIPATHVVVRLPGAKVHFRPPISARFEPLAFHQSASTQKHIRSTAHGGFRLVADRTSATSGCTHVFIVIVAVSN